MITLGIDTSTARSSVALVSGNDVLQTREVVDARRHVETLAEMVRDVLGDHQLDAIGCGVGPGPYTGVRAGVVTAQMLGLARQVPVYGICSLDALAQQFLGAEPFTVGIDARRREVYWAQYDGAGRRLDGPRILPADTRIDVGFGVTDHTPHAVDVARLVNRALASGERVSDVDVTLVQHGTDDGSTAAAVHDRTLLPPFPLYVRRPDVTVT
jgi:tRNA threonylcarbamoyladenosine biosynthesis protein TsaB